MVIRVQLLAQCCTCIDIGKHGRVTARKSDIKHYTAQPVIQKLSTNLSNMYEDGKWIRQLLDNLLKVLLDIHLHSQREHNDINICKLAIEAPPQVHQDIVTPSVFDDVDTSHTYQVIRSWRLQCLWCPPYRHLYPNQANNTWALYLSLYETKTR